MRISSATIVEARTGKKYIKLSFSFNRDLIEWVKSFHTYSYNPTKKYWKIPLTVKNVKEVQNKGFLIQDPLKHWVKEKLDAKKGINNVIDIPGLKLTPFNYQYWGINFINYRNGRALIADEPGLGKTIQALGWLQLNPEIRPALIVSPSTLKFNWAIESHKWMTRPKLQILSSQTPYSLTGNILIINPDILQYWAEDLFKYGIKATIVDEIHYFKEPDSIRYLALIEITKKCFNRIGLSGTPIINKPIEIYYIWKWIDSTTLPNWPYFTRQFCEAHHNGWAMDYSGAANLTELNTLLTDSIMLRRTKQEVLPELPKKLYSVIPLDIDNRKEYDRAFNDFMKYHIDKVLKELDDVMTVARKSVRKSTKNKDIYQLDLFEESIEGDLIDATMEKVANSGGLMQVNALRQLAAIGKMKEFWKWLKGFLLSGEKIVIFCEHRAIMQQIIDTFPKITVYIHGGVKGTKRQAAITEFQNNPKIKIFVGNKAAQEGVTLTAANTVAHVEYPWNSTSVDQRNDRCNRIGAKYNTNVLYFVAHHTYEETLIKIIDVKREITNQAIDNKGIDEAHVLKKLLKQFKTKAL